MTHMGLFGTVVGRGFWDQGLHPHFWNTMESPPFFGDFGSPVGAPHPPRNLFRPAHPKAPQTSGKPPDFPVVQWHQLFFPFFLVPAPLKIKNGLPTKKGSFFPRVTGH